MKRSIVLWISFIVFLIAFLLHAAEAAEPSGQGTARQEILILNSYHPGYAWSDDEQAGIVDVFRAKDKNWLPVIEYLDLLRLPDGRHLAELKQLFRRKYQNKKFSVVIAMDNSALEFAMDNQSELFRNAPIVFCGINNYTPSMLKGHTNVTGIAEALDQAGTIDLMLRLHPKTREILLIHDYTVTGLEARKEIEALASRLAAQVRFRFLDRLSMDEVLKELEGLTKDSLALLRLFTTDKTGHTFGMIETAQLITKHSPVPVYSTHEQRLGFGIVGGKLLSARIHGANAARIALRVLAGEKASAIPVVLESDSKFMFDYKVMSRFGIPLSALPEGSTVINKPVSLYAAHRVVIQAALGIIGILIMVIFMLTVIIIQRRRSAIALRESEERLHFHTDNSPMAVIERNADFIVMRWTGAAEKMFGWSFEETIGKSIMELRMVHEEDIPIVQSIMQRLTDGKSKHVVSSTRNYTKKGEVIHCEWYSTVLHDSAGKMISVMSQVLDITERKKAEDALRASRQQMRAFAGRLQAVREEERTQIAREIHDELGGALTGMKIDFSLLTRTALKIENETVRTSLLGGMDSMTKSIDSTIQTVRRIAMKLRPGILDDLGLVAALEWQLKDFEKRTGIRCEYLPPVEDISLDAYLSTALFRIVQEALTNVARHSGATEVHVRLRADADSSTLEVKDNGKGIEKKKTLSSKSLGLLGMRERAQMFGGRITVTGTPGIGTIVTVEISPVEKRKMDRDQEGAAG